MAGVWRGLFAIVGFATLALQYWLHFIGRGELTVVEQTINYFSYFTILTNILTDVLYALVDPRVRLR